MHNLCLKGTNRQHKPWLIKARLPVDGNLSHGVTFNRDISGVEKEQPCFCAQSDTHNEAFEICMGQQDLGERNDNGEYFLDLCSENNLIIGWTIVQYRNVYKVTRRQTSYKSNVKK